MVALLPSTAGAQDAAPTIAVTGVDLANSTIEITNHGDADVDPNGIILCNFPAYAPIEGAEVIPPGGSITIDAGAHGITLDPTSGEMGLYTSPDYENADAIISYVEWGDPGHQRAPVAVAAGLWVEGSADISDGVLTATTTTPTSPADWVAGAADDAAGDTAAEETETTELAQTGTAAWLMASAALGLLAFGGLLVGFGRRQVI